MDTRKLILFFGVTDDANTTYRWSKAINQHSAEFRARVVVLKAHDFGYKEDIVWDVDNFKTDPQSEEVYRLFDECALLCLACSNRVFQQFLMDGYPTHPALESVKERVKGKPWMTRHHGSFYRDSYMYIDYMDCTTGMHARFIGPDLMRFATKGAYAETQLPQYPYLHCIPHYAAEMPTEITRTPVVMHVPSNKGKKGTDAIRRAMGRMPSHVEYVEISGVSAQEALEAKRRCDIYIDQLIPDIGGYGASSVEALAQGKAVLASINHVLECRDEIEQHFALPPIINIESEEDLVVELRKLISPQTLLEKKRESWQWFQDTCSPESIAIWLDEVFKEVISTYK